MYYVYLLKSRVDEFTYIGYTSDLKKRLKEHNQGKTKSIEHRIPFDLIYYEAYKNKTDARKRELELKNKGYSKEQLIKRLEDSLKQ
jgi:putative endonuclease